MKVNFFMWQVEQTIILLNSAKKDSDVFALTIIIFVIEIL